MKLIIVNGLPGSGKSTLAKPLSRQLGLPLIAKDTIKEFLFDQLGTKDRAWSKTLGKASNDFLYSLAEIMLADGQSLIIENAFEKTYAVPRIRHITEKYQLQVVEIYCATNPKIRKQRFIDRNESGDRHRGHADHVNYAENAGPEPTVKYAAMEISRVVYVDTTNDVDIAELTRLINSLHES